MMNPPKQQSVQLFCKERVYQVQTVPNQKADLPDAEKPWRPMVWEEPQSSKYMDDIRQYRPNRSVSKARVLLLGPAGGGKSSFFNSVCSIFRGHVTSQVIRGTTQLRTYSLRAGREFPLPLVLCDTMGVESLDMADIVSILEGHVPDCYQFGSLPIGPDTPGFITAPTLSDRIHCVTYVMDACTVSTMSWLLVHKLNIIGQTVNKMGIPQMVLMTKIDEACESVANDIRNVYSSKVIRKKVKDLSTVLGLPISCIMPVKNYSQELEVNLHCNTLLLSAFFQILRFTNDYFEDSK